MTATEAVAASNVEEDLPDFDDDEAAKESKEESKENGDAKKGGCADVEGRCWHFPLKTFPELQSPSVRLGFH